MDDDPSQTSFASVRVSRCTLKCDILYSSAENVLHQRKKKKNNVSIDYRKSHPHKE